MSIGSGTENEQVKRVELSMHLGVVGTVAHTLSREGSYHLVLDHNFMQTHWLNKETQNPK